ncbi:hypothetical protein HK098_002908 [Nowakowskiella sp. JEL0407]|nr:hypothetical protein HK098_002908 [Nowakowskiella sp. JEL0407]
MEQGMESGIQKRRPMQFNLYAKDNPEIFIDCRKWIREIDEILEAGNMCILRGLGGSGKTFVANKYAFLMLARGYIVAKFTADTEANLIRDFSEYLMKLLKVDKLPVRGGKMSDYLQFARECDLPKQFIILDNVKYLSDIEDFKHDKNPNVKYLITSRTGFTDQQLRLLYDITNGLPLRLAIAARILRNPAQSLDDYVAMVEENKSKMKFNFNPEKDAPDDVDELFREVSLSIDELTATDSYAFLYLSLLTELDPDFIVEIYLVESIEEFQNQPTLQAADDILGLDRDIIAKCRLKALKLGLVEFSTQSGSWSTIRVPRCVQAEIRDQVKKRPAIQSAAAVIAKLYEKRKKLDDKLYSEFRKALKRGMLPVQRMTLVLAGQGRAGKTSLLRALRDKSFQKDEESTVYIEPVEVDIKPIEVEQHFLENWKDRVRTEQLLKSLHAGMKSTLSASSPELNDAPIFKNHDIPETETSESTTTSINMFAQLHKEKNRITPEENEDVVQHLVSLRLSAPQNDKFANNTEVDLNSTTLAVYDFAGQSQYSVFQQIFITSQAIYLVVFRLDTMFLPFTGKINPHELQVVLSWLTTIHLRAPEAKVLLIGTQADNMWSRNYNSLSSLLSFIPTTLKSCLIPNPALKMKDPDESLIFVTSSKNGTGVKNLRDSIDRAVNSSVSKSGPKPVDWIRLQVRIAEMVAEKKCHLMYQLSDLLQITANEFRISEKQELDAVLQYFHAIGVVLYFPQNSELRNVVFPDPQAVVNVISSVFRYYDKPPAPGEVKSCNHEALEKLKKEQIWMRSLLEELWACFLQPNELFVVIRTASGIRFDL